MNARNEALYRLRLADGYLADAERELSGEHFRTAFTDAQEAVENAGKAIVACFGPVRRTHEPAAQLGLLLEGETPNQ